MLLRARVRLISVPWHSPPSATHLTRAGQLHTHCWGPGLALSSEKPRVLGCPSLSSCRASPWPTAARVLLRLGSSQYKPCTGNCPPRGVPPRPLSRPVPSPPLPSTPPHVLTSSTSLLRANSLGSMTTHPPKRPVLPPSLSISLLSPGGKGAPCKPDTRAAPAEPSFVEDKDPTPSRVATLCPAPRQPLPAQQPHLAFSHIEDSNFVCVV